MQMYYKVDCVISSIDGIAFDFTITLANWARPSIAWPSKHSVIITPTDGFLPRKVHFVNYILVNFNWREDSKLLGNTNDFNQSPLFCSFVGCRYGILHLDAGDKEAYKKESTATEKRSLVILSRMAQKNKILLYFGSVLILASLAVVYNFGIPVLKEKRMERFEEEVVRLNEAKRRNN